MKTYFFETYGCEMNIAESAAVEQLLIARGWTQAKSAQVADMAIINTCSVRETAENRIMGRLGWFNGLKAVRAKKLGAKTKMLDEAVEWCRERGVEFYAVNRDYPEEDVTLNQHFSRKLKVDMFIDDRNVGGLPDWGTIYQMIHLIL